MLRAALVILLGSVFWASGAAARPCSGVTGLFSGVAETPDGTKAEVTLNLLCRDAKYAAQIFTSMGDFEVKEVSATADHVHVSFDSGAALGTFDMTQKGASLAGTLESEGERGTISLRRTGDALGPDAMKPRLDLTPAQWREDLQFYARELPKRHAKAFFLLPREKFEAEIAALDARLDHANGDEVLVGLQAITKSIGDGHTGIVAPPDRRVIPIEIKKFGNDFRIIAVGPGLDAALGARIVRIGGMPIADVWQRVMTLTPQGELIQLRDANALAYLARGYALHGLGIIPDRNRATYTLMGYSGRIFTFDIKGLDPNQTVPMKSGYSDATLRFQKPNEPFWYKAIPENEAVYCAWHSYQSLDDNAKSMFALVDQTHAKKLVIDMRDNGGGDNTVGYAQVIKPIEVRADLNARGHLYVLIGSETFSAAMNNAAQFQDETRAILAGETIGEKPNSYQEPRQFRLPNSHLVVRASTLWYAFRKSGPNVVAPEKEIIPTWDDVKNGRDPVLDWALARPVN